jgi:hypothetical protein
MIHLLYLESEICLWGMSHELGKVRRSLAELKRDMLLCNETKDLVAQGYRQNCSIGPGDNLQSLAAGTLGRLLKQCPTPRALVFHHSYPESACLPADNHEPGFMSRVRYFPPSLMREFKLDHIPYLVSFGSGCTGLLTMLMMATGLGRKPSENPILCLTADVKPPGTTFDASREKILTSDCSSGFCVGSDKRGYRLLGISYYSTTRQIVPLVQIVKQSVQMIRELAKETGIDLAASEVVLHYPNAFPAAWDMVTQYLHVPMANRILDSLAERAHCKSSDPVISLGKAHGAGAGRVHIVLNFGAGIHLGACILREEVLP